MTSMVTIENLQDHEKDQVGRLLVESYSEYKDRYQKLEDWEEYAKDLAASVHSSLVDRILVAKADNEILGTLQLYSNSEMAYNDPALGITSPIIRMLAVSPTARGKGIAQALIQECIHYSRDLGASHLYLHSGEMMSKAIRLYEWLGFKRDPSKEYDKLSHHVKCFRFELNGSSKPTKGRTH